MPMTTADLTVGQIDRLIAHLAPMVAYLKRLHDRMCQLRFDRGDAVYREAYAAYRALLSMESHLKILGADAAKREAGGTGG